MEIYDNEVMKINKNLETKICMVVFLLGLSGNVYDRFDINAA